MVNCGLDRRFDLGIHAFDCILAGYADSHAGQIAAQRGGKVGDRDWSAGGIVRIGTRDRFQGQRGILD